MNITMNKNTVNLLSKAKQSKAKQSKAKQSKAKQSKAKQSYNCLLNNFKLFIFILFIFNSCSNELITVVDEYNPLYEVKVIPGNNSISINFWSGILASDFAGFNLYIHTNKNLTNALLNEKGGYPTISFSTHARSNITLKFPTNANPQNNNLYYVSVTAYGTNDLAEGGKIETRINAIIPVIPRAEATNTVSGTISAGSLTATSNSNRITASNWKIQSYGYQTNFNAVTVFTNNNNLTNSADYLVGGLYIFSNSTDLVKVWITTNGSNYISATNNKANICNTI